MEYEIRFYYPSEKLDEILNMLDTQKSLKRHARSFEKTVQFDHPCEKMSFYSKEIDGRFRIRISKSDDDEKCLLSWKRRLPDTMTSEINKEEEVELNIQPNEYENLIFIVESVLRMKQVESYERYRTKFTNIEVEIAVDEYPFGIALEIENKSTDQNPTKVVKNWTDKLGLDIQNSYRLSWDDKYAELCEQQGIQPSHHVTFNTPMPKI